jgi:hypothetical protein
MQRGCKAPRRALGRSSLNVLRSGSFASPGMTRRAVHSRLPMSTRGTVPTAVTLCPCGHGEEYDKQHDECSVRIANAYGFWIVSM